MLFTLTSAYAQKPVISGYLGKRNYGMVKFNTGIRTQHPEKAKGPNEVSGSFYDGFSYKSELEINYGHIVSNRFIIEVQAGLNNLAMDLNGLSPFYFRHSPGSQREYQNYYGYPKINDIYGGFTTKFYRRNRGALAPVGVYYGLKLNFHTYTIHLTDIIADYTSNWPTTEYISTDINYGKFKYNYIEMSGSVGVSTAITDNLLTDMGLSIGWGGPGSGFYEVDVPNTQSLASDLLFMINRYHVGKVYFGLAYMF
ncbi:MAG: hypothetical protein ACI9JN_001836 [Bacteroidia bacterium]|jgi:hypothetical protein